MKYRLDVRPYTSENRVDLVQRPGVTPKLHEVDVKQAIANVALSTEQRHNGFRLLTVSRVVTKIKNCTEESIVLDASEITVIKEAFDRIQGFGFDDVELCRRVYEAERVEE